MKAWIAFGLQKSISVRKILFKFIKLEDAALKIGAISNTSNRVTLHNFSKKK